MTEVKTDTTDVSSTYRGTLTALTKLARTLRPEEQDAYFTMADRRAEIIGAAKGVPDAHVLHDISEALADTVWEDYENQILERPVHLRVGAWTSAEQSQDRFHMRFQYRIAGCHEYQHGWAELTPKGDEEWALVTDKSSWLHRHKAEHGLSDGEIDQLYDNVNKIWLASRFRFRDGRPDE
jgi:hypothetical protein